MEYDLAQSSKIGAQLAEDQAAKEAASLAQGFAGQAAINSGNTTTVGATTTTVYSHKPSAQGSEAGQLEDIKRTSVSLKLKKRERLSSLLVCDSY